MDDELPPDCTFPTADPDILIANVPVAGQAFSTTAEYSHLVMWSFITPLGPCPAVVLWGCWEQGDWYEA